MWFDLLAGLRIDRNCLKMYRRIKPNNYKLTTSHDNREQINEKGTMLQYTAY